MAMGMDEQCFPFLSEQEILEDGGELRMKLIDSLRMLSADGVLWGQPTEAGFAFRRDHYLGDEAEALGDVEIHSKLESPQPARRFRIWLARWPFPLGIMGWLPVSQYLALLQCAVPMSVRPTASLLWKHEG